MKVHELIAALQKMDPNHVVVIEMDDDYWHIGLVDGAVLQEPDAKNPKWAFPFGDEESTINAVRISA